MTDIPEDAWSEAKAIARKAVWADGRGMIGRERNYLEDRIARAILADRAAQAERMARLEDALRNLAHEMRFLLRNHPKMDGGLYRNRLDEAARALSQEGSEPS